METSHALPGRNPKQILLHDKCLHQVESRAYIPKHSLSSISSISYIAIIIYVPYFNLQLLEELMLKSKLYGIYKIRQP